jgi:hypothetical protein
MNPVNVHAVVRPALLGGVLAFAVAPAQGRSQSPEACPPAPAEQREEALRFYQVGSTSVLAESWEEALPALEQAARLAQKAGVPVNPRLLEEIRKRR